MCELFGLCSAEKVSCNDLLEIFFSHGETNPDGWGMAVFDGNSAAIEKEPISSAESVYLKHRLSDEIKEDVLLAHIRKASKGGLEYKNCHPFKRRDASGRLWTLIHNGTIFESALVALTTGMAPKFNSSPKVSWACLRFFGLIMVLRVIRICAAT